jgi:hypothetical protein
MGIIIETKFTRCIKKQAVPVNLPRKPRQPKP